MRILVCTGVGLVVGLLFLIQFLGWFGWFPSGAYMVIHSPALVLADILVHGEAGWNVIPLAMVLQWMVIGATVGAVLQLTRPSKRS